MWRSPTAAASIFLLKEAEDAGGPAFVTDVDELALRGVESRVPLHAGAAEHSSPRGWCRTPAVPSGVAEVARLQSREHYSYLKPEAPRRRPALAVLGSRCGCRRGSPTCRSPASARCS